MNQIEALAERMVSQDNRGTQYPLFIVQTKGKRYHEDGGESERIEDAEFEDYCDNCQELYEAEGDVPDRCPDCSYECFRKFDWEYQHDLRAGVFFSEEACENHIKQNNYHYNEARSYVIGAWRNPEMEIVFEHLIKSGGQAVPTHYRHYGPIND